MSHSKSIEMTTGVAGQARIGWVDYAKGICIILVVMMHTVNGIEHTLHSEGWMREIVDFARPFRMPDFFLISGLFLSRTLNGPLLDYLDHKLVHFVYFYLLWITLQLGILEVEMLISDPALFAKVWLVSLVEPLNSLWFIHMLAIFYVVSRLVKDVPQLLILAIAVGLQTLYQFGLIDTGWTVVDRFANRFVYFWFGYMAAPWIFQFARTVAQKAAAAGIFLLVWAFANYFLVELGAHNMPFSSLALGGAGAIAICIISASLEKAERLTFLRYSGQHSIAIYLGFVFPLRLIEKFSDQLLEFVPSVGWLSAISLAIIVALTLVARVVAIRIGFSWLYIRPGLAQGLDEHLPASVRTGLVRSGL